MGCAELGWVYRLGFQRCFGHLVQLKLEKVAFQFIWSFDMGATFLTPWMSVETRFSPVMTLNGSDTLTGWKCSYAEEWRRLALHCSGRLLQRCLESMIEQVLSLLERGMLERNEQRHEWDELCQWLCLFDPCLWSMEPRLDWLDCLNAALKTCLSMLPGDPDAVLTFSIQWQVCSGSPETVPKKLWNS